METGYSSRDLCSLLTERLGMFSLSPVTCARAV